MSPVGERTDGGDCAAVQIADRHRKGLVTKSEAIALVAEVERLRRGANGPCLATGRIDGLHRAEDLLLKLIGTMQEKEAEDRRRRECDRCGYRFDADELRGPIEQPCSTCRAEMIEA